MSGVPAASSGSSSSSSSSGASGTARTAQEVAVAAEAASAPAAAEAAPSLDDQAPPGGRAEAGGGQQPRRGYFSFGLASLHRSLMRGLQEIQAGPAAARLLPSSRLPCLASSCPQAMQLAPAAHCLHAQPAMARRILCPADASQPQWRRARAPGSNGPHTGHARSRHQRARCKRRPAGESRCSHRAGSTAPGHGQAAQARPSRLYQHAVWVADTTSVDEQAGSPCVAVAITQQC
jgi:hypothetical protein